ncbi:MAG: DUF1611 domain-containing protein [Pseudomonadota bacterium]
MNAVLSNRLPQMMSENVSADSAPSSMTIDSNRLAAAARAFTTRRVSFSRVTTLLLDVLPVPGQVVLARVRRLGHHTRLQDRHGRRVTLFPGDEIIVCYGERYAPQQFEGRLPAALGPCHLVASGGVAAQAVSWHRRISRGPTEIDVLGVLGDTDGRALTIDRFRLAAPAIRRRPNTVIAVAGTSMDSGKTTTAAYFVRGLTKAGLRVGAAKITGTGACNDYYLMRDAGAVRVVDFTDAGFVSTFGLDLVDIDSIYASLLNELCVADVDVAVIEIADGLQQSETARLLSDDEFRQSLDGVIFCAQDAMGASAGVDWLTARSHNVLAVSGVLSAAPLAIRETCELVAAPVLGTDGLSERSIALGLIDSAKSAKGHPR